jgi:uncharacterized protein (DUF608 family)
MNRESGSSRRDFLQQAAAAGAASKTSPSKEQNDAGNARARRPVAPIAYPRVFEGPHLKMISFPLGGVAAGSIGLGGRGQLRDWEIFNKPDKGGAPAYGFPSIWACATGGQAVARVLESRIEPPYEGASGLGANNAPGLSRLETARFTGEYPMARIEFRDRDLPVRVSLEAFSPFIPHDAEESGLPVAILRYRVTNPGGKGVEAAIGFSVDNPMRVTEQAGGAAALHVDSRSNEFRDSGVIAGLLMRNPQIAEDHPMRGEFALCALDPGKGKFTHWRGWAQTRWWNAPMLYWDDFSADGELGEEPEPRNAVGTIALKKTIPAGASADYTFVLAWRFPNRTPAWCGWTAPKGQEHVNIGNHYATRFPGAWDAAEYAARNLETLEARTNAFVLAFRESTLPAVVKDAASANLSTLATTTCFRTADGEFHGFEGVNDHLGCCFGNCTHVWNYETATPHLFPSLARSLRKASFGYSMDEAGAMRFRQLLPDGAERFGFAAADGQMGQIVHACLDWKLSGDSEWLATIWPQVKKAIAFAWVPGGWDANRDGVLEGVQHNTYDVEFYGPNPMCGIYYLAALRACEEMAHGVNDDAGASEYRRLFENGSRWIDANLFNGEFYVQKIRAFSKDQIAPALRSNMGADDPEHPQYQVGEGCLVDQLVGQYLAEVAGLGPLVSREHARAALRAVYRYNYKRSLARHDTVQRTFALNDEAALVICDYGKAERPRIPFPYYAEVMTGFEYSTAAHMLYAGMVREGIECIGNIRARYDGEKRNPWDEAECGHHYARAMASWSALLALSGFRYNGPNAAVTAGAAARSGPGEFRCFWSSGTGWGTFARAVDESRARFRLRVIEGRLPVRSCNFQAGGNSTTARLNGREVPHELRGVVFQFDSPLVIEAGGELRLGVL